MKWTETIVIDRPLAQVQQSVADEHQLMQWSAWPEATGYTCAVHGDGQSLGSAIVMTDRHHVKDLELLKAHVEAQPAAA